MNVPYLVYLYNLWRQIDCLVYFISASGLILFSWTCHWLKENICQSTDLDQYTRVLVQLHQWVHTHTHARTHAHTHTHTHTWQCSELALLVSSSWTIWSSWRRPGKRTRSRAQQGGVHELLSFVGVIQISPNPGHLSRESQNPLYFLATICNTEYGGGKTGIWVKYVHAKTHCSKICVIIFIGAIIYLYLFICSVIFFKIKS